MRADLHIHTYFSDGTMTPEEIVTKAKEKGVGIVAITDHNSYASWERFQKAALEADITPIKGAEINCQYNGRVFHVLAYGFENTAELVKLINQADSEMQRMSDDLVENLAKGYGNVSLEDFTSYTYDRRKGGWKGLHYLLDRGISDRLFGGFKYYKEYGCDFIAYEFPEMKALCAAIKEAGGYSVLAHPANYYSQLSREELEGVLEEIKLQGIAGIECYYPTHSELMTQTCIDFCKANDLLITVGSDEHGAFGEEAKSMEQTIGCMPVALEQLCIQPLLEE
ncbi:MAG: PHP domain-containing protein [Cellulosilyticaceae bacterium]